MTMRDLDEGALWRRRNKLGGWTDSQAALNEPKDCTRGRRRADRLPTLPLHRLAASSCTRFPVRSLAFLTLGSTLLTR